MTTEGPVKNNQLNMPNGVHWPARLRARERHLTELTRTLRFRDISEPTADANWQAGCEGEGSPVMTFARVEH